MAQEASELIRLKRVVKMKRSKQDRQKVNEDDAEKEIVVRLKPRMQKVKVRVKLMGRAIPKPVLS